MALTMLYRIGQFILDTEREILLLASTQEVVSNHSRISQVLTILLNSYPKTVSKNELTRLLWPEDEVTEWALSRQISQVRQLLANYDAETQYIRTVHTKGFKLDLEPELIDSISTTHNQNKSETEIVQSQPKRVIEKFNKKWGPIGLLVSAIIVALIIYFNSHTQNITKSIYGEITPPQQIIFPTDKNWTSSAPDTIRFTPDGIRVEPIGPDSLFVSTSLRQAALYQGADFSIKMKVDQAFVDNKGWLRLYYQTTLEGWPGEWDCGVDDNIIQTLDFEYHCVIDERGSFVKILADEPVNFGIKIHQLQPLGYAIIESAQLDIPASISTDMGWRTTNGVKLEYNRGVTYRPNSTADQLSTNIKGPTNVTGSDVAFTLQIDDSYKQPDFVLQLFLISKEGKWQDCFVSGADIKSNIFTTNCRFQNIADPFILNMNQQIEIGVRPFGNVISGELKIIGISVTD